MASAEPQDMPDAELFAQLPRGAMLASAGHGDRLDRDALVAALDDDEHERVQRDRYAKRRDALLAAVRGAGFTVEHSEAGLYLWATRGESGRATVAWLAERGILVAPGEFYGPAGAQHVRVALTATDERIAAAVTRLAG